MITRYNLADQLREYQIRSKHDWASPSFFSATTSFTSRPSSVDWSSINFLRAKKKKENQQELPVCRHMRLAFILLFITMLLLLCMKIKKQERLARKKKRRMLLPLSM